MKNFKLIALASMALAQVSLISAMFEIGEPRTGPRTVHENGGNYLPKKYIGLNEKYKGLVEQVLVHDIAEIVMGYADYEAAIRENNRLYSAMVGNDIAGMRLAIENGADVNLILNISGETPLILITKMLDGGIYDSKSGYIVNFAQYLIKEGANINAQDADGDTALMLAIKAMYIVASWGGSHITTVNVSGVRAGILREIESLIDLLFSESKVNINLQNKSGQTALMFATTLGDKDLIRKLISHGADRNLKNSVLKTAYDYAKNDDIREILYPKKLRAEDERLRQEKEIEVAKESEIKRKKEEKKKEFDVSLASLTSKDIQKNYLQKQEALRIQRHEERLREQRAQEALAQAQASANQSEENAWEEEPEDENTEDWDGAVQED